MVKGLQELDGWDEGSIDTKVREIAAQLNIKGRQIIHPTRAALSGKTVGPSLFALMEVLGKDKNIKRLEKAIANLD